MPETFVEAEELVNYPRSVASVRVACLLRERGGTVKVSLRGKGDVDVQQIAAQFGGGGHANAAGCTRGRRRSTRRRATCSPRCARAVDGAGTS